ncbi:MAG: pyrimidine 5'-nucleotidase [Proteobacteria bacterium]|nr:pyrimidine 5'-nucleotidase [Pseudomonadota bacterium]
MRADLTHVDTWLFDLDNTLYPMDSGFMGQIETRMTAYVQKVTGLPRDEAYRLQKQYLAEYGLTLGGMIAHWGVDPDEYHANLHDISLEGLAHDPRLISALERLPGRRLIFTNADDVHARRVMDRLNLSRLFDEVFHIGSANYVPKPAPATFAKLVADHAVDPTATAFFEDRADNLSPAFDLGMTTVLVGPHAEASTAPFVRYKAAHLSSFLEDALLKDAAA